MSAAGFASWALEALVASALLMLLVLSVRAPARRMFGARVGYALWALPALRLVLPPLPAAWHGGAAMPVSDAAVGIGAQAGSALTYVTVITTSDVYVSAGGVPWTALLLVLWLAGAAALLVWQATDYLRFRSRVLHAATPLDRVGRITVVESDGASGPVAFGIVRKVVAFPRDFAGRYDAGERDLALAHELGHHARGDLVANWIALTTLALHWWNPIAWAAFRAFRADQEMANDAGVLARAGVGARHAYGCAIVKAAHGRAVTATCHLHSVRDLKGRLKMLNRREGSGARLAAGMAVTAALTLGGLFVTASGSAAAASVKAGVASTTGVDLDALDAVAAFQSADDASPPAPAPAGATRSDIKRVVVTKNGRTQTFEGAAADAYLAANPVPLPPAPPPAPGAMPPAPPAPPVPPMPGTAGDRQVRVFSRSGVQPWVWDGKVPPVQVSARDCRVGPDGAESQTTLQQQKGRTQVTVICTNRIQKLAERAGADAERAARASVDAEGIRRQALASAVTSLHASRDSIAANRDMSEAQRSEALKGIDDAIREVEAEARSGG